MIFSQHAVRGVFVVCICNLYAFRASVGITVSVTVSKWFLVA